MAYKNKQQQRDYQKNWMKRRRKEWLDANGPCVDCGSADNLEVDHVDPSTKIAHAVWSWRESRRLEELAKCCVRCAICHMLKSVTERAKGEANGNSKLKAAQVLEIRALRGILPYDKIAERYNVTKSAVNHVMNDRWTHI